MNVKLLLMLLSNLRAAGRALNEVARKFDIFLEEAERLIEGDGTQDILVSEWKTSEPEKSMSCLVLFVGEWQYRMAVYHKDIGHFFLSNGEMGGMNNGKPDTLALDFLVDKWAFLQDTTRYEQ